MGRMGWKLVPAWIRRSYAAKLVLGLALVVAVVCLIGGYIYLHTGTELTRDTQRDLVTTADIEAENVDEWFDRMHVTMLSLSDAAALQSDDQTQVAVHLWDVVDRDDDIEAAYYVDTRNDRVIMATGNAEILSVEGALTAGGQRDLTTIAGAAGDGVTVTDAFRPHPETAPVMVFATKVTDRPDRAIVAVVNLESLSRAKLHHETAAQIVIRDADGTIVLADQTDRILTRDPLANATDERGFSHAREDGTRMAVGVAPVESHEWTVTAREPTAQAYALQSDISRQILWLLVVVVGGAVGIFLTLGRSNVAAVRTLSTKARELQTGHLDVDVSSEREDEFGTLYEAFDTMRRSLKRQIEQAQTARDEARDARDEARAARAESERLRDHLETKAGEYGEAMAACADGDLDRRLDPSSESAAMTAVATAFNDMMDDVQRQNEQLESVARILSHDLRNPLNVANGHAGLLAEQYDAESASVVVEELCRMEAIVEDALLLARGQVDDSRPVSLGTCAAEAWSHVETGEATLDVIDSPTLLADETMLIQALENLFRNSVEHAGECATVCVGSTANGFYVADDGPGIPAAERDAVFEVGYTSNRDGGGSGFGLAIVRRIANAHGWEVSLATRNVGPVCDPPRSIDDCGACFCFSDVGSVVPTGEMCVRETGN
ncbi:ATP-binding protein [Haloarchaeobius sp. DT45]|uniref:sensor histidine kinase n=1 Tax=Haloarchaeobius sp. DT45 TaxID=3446116 RepID=UPI003F6D6F8D